MNLYEDLKWRGLVQDISDEELINKLNNEKITFYIGTDPTADSMHIGHFVALMVASRFPSSSPISSVLLKCKINYKFKNSYICECLKHYFYGK